MDENNINPQNKETIESNQQPIIESPQNSATTQNPYTQSTDIQLRNIPNPEIIPAQNSKPQAIIQNKGMFSGRLGRISYFMAIIYIFAFWFIAALIMLILTSPNSGPRKIATVIVVALGFSLEIPVFISVSIRRLHDLNKTGTFFLCTLIPYIGILMFIPYLFFPGSKEPNQYGEPNNKPFNIKKVLFGI